LFESVLFSSDQKKNDANNLRVSYFSWINCNLLAFCYCCLQRCIRVENKGDVAHNTFSKILLGVQYVIKKFKTPVAPSLPLCVPVGVKLNLHF
jgi:hypothetical protein